MIQTNASRAISENHLIENRRKVKSIHNVFLTCSCGSQRVESTGMVYTTYPVLYEYICMECGKVETSRKSYPYLDYEYEDEDYEMSFTYDDNYNITSVIVSEAE